MRKALLAILLALGLAAPAAAQVPFQIRYDTVNPTTLTCRPGQGWQNNNTHVLYGCDTKTSTWFALGGGGTPSFPIRSTSGANIVEINGVAGDPNTSAWFATDGTTKFAGFSIDVETAGAFLQMQASDGQRAFQIDTNPTVGTANYLLEDQQFGIKVDRHLNVGNGIPEISEDFQACTPPACPDYHMEATHASMIRRWTSTNSTLTETYGNGFARLQIDNTFGNTTVQAYLDGDGFRVTTTGAKPACSVATRGNIWRTEGGAGVADTLEACTKDAGDTYAWRSLLP